MPTVKLAGIVKYCDRALQLEGFRDWDGAVNGLQVENRGDVRRLAAAVDASLATCQKAIQAGADLLIVHHGLFWGPSHPWTGRRYELIRLLLDHDLALYSAHLPLDAHPKWGNNILICKALGLVAPEPFFESKGRRIGYQARAAIDREKLRGKLGSILGVAPLLIPGGPEVCRRIGVVSGGAGSELKQAAAEGVDTFITGEGPHWTYALAEELGVNVFYGGHYATETFGVQAVACAVGKRFQLPWCFVDHPTGL